MLCLCALWAGLAAPTRAQEGARLDRFKAVFMYSFAEYIAWPGEQPDDSVFTIGILGQSPLQELLSEIATKKKVAGKRLGVAVYEKLDEIETCEMLFVTAGFAEQLPDLKTRLGASDVLTVSDTPGLAARGVAINFVVVEGKLKFEINTAVLRAAGLQASSQLLKLATLIPGTEAKGETP